MPLLSMKNKKLKLIPAIPPDDYQGTIADWMVALVIRNLWNDSDGSWYGDVMISERVWSEILNECENE